MIGLCHGEHDVAMVAAGLGIIANAVHGHGDEFSFGSLQLCTLLDGQVVEMGGFFHQPGAGDGFCFKHGKYLLWIWVGPRPELAGRG